MKNELGDPEDYELRFYSSHNDAVNLEQSMLTILLVRMRVSKIIHCG